jgi:hypothetical protein
MLSNEKSITTIMGRMPAGDWKQWAMDWPNWIQGAVDPRFEKFVE